MLQIHNTVYTTYKTLLYNTAGTNTPGEQKGCDYPKGINIDKKKERLLKLKTTLLKTTHTDNKNNLIPKSAAY